MDKNIVKKIIDYDGKGEYLGLATIVASHGSSPREAGTQMVVYPDGSISGTVGGGPVEYETIKKARHLLEKGEDKKYEFDISNEEVAQTGGICGGHVEIFIETINMKC